LPQKESSKKMNGPGSSILTKKARATLVPMKEYGCESCCETGTKGCGHGQQSRSKEVHVGQSVWVPVFATMWCEAV
jgi:hypothetical protein